jgi:hypothetical protein
MSIMDGPWLNEDGASGRARVKRTMAAELLNTLLGYADQYLVVIMGIVGVAAKMRVHRLDAGFLISVNPDPIVAGGRSGS